MEEHQFTFFANNKREREEIKKARSLGVSDAEILDLRIQAEIEQRMRRRKCIGLCKEKSQWKKVLKNPMTPQA